MIFLSISYSFWICLSNIISQETPHYLDHNYTYISTQEYKSFPFGYGVFRQNKNKQEKTHENKSW